MANKALQCQQYLRNKGKTEAEVQELVSDFTKVRIDANSSGDYISVWDVSGITKPTDSELSAVNSDADKIEALNIVRNNRAKEYPSVVDQLDEIYHNGIDAWKATIKKTKDKYPK